MKNFSLLDKNRSVNIKVLLPLSVGKVSADLSSLDLIGCLVTLESGRGL